MRGETVLGVSVVGRASRRADRWSSGAGALSAAVKLLGRVRPESSDFDHTGIASDYGWHG
jgi:hypothetical protein